MRDGEVEADDACAPRRPAASPGRPAAGRPSRSAASAGPSRASPSRGCRRRPAPTRCLRAVAQRRQVGDQADVPEQQRDGGVGRDREDVPDQRAAELRPEAHRVRVGQQPVEEPRPAQVQQREQPAQATANSVIASAKRLIDVRHSCCSSSRIAEISVPAWPMPIHQTKLMIVEAPADRDVDAPDADALRTAGSAIASSSTMQQQRSRCAKPSHQPRGVCRGQHDRR